MGFGYTSFALPGLRILRAKKQLTPGTVHCIQQVLNKCYFFVLPVDPSRKKADLLVIERTQQ